MKIFQYPYDMSSLSCCLSASWGCLDFSEASLLHFNIVLSLWMLQGMVAMLVMA